MSQEKSEDLSFTPIMNLSTFYGKKEAGENQVWKYLTRHASERGRAALTEQRVWRAALNRILYVTNINVRIAETDLKAGLGRT